MTRGAMRIAVRIIVCLFAVVLVLAGGVYLYLLSSLPQTEGRLVVAGPKAEIRIERDADGIPTIVARDDDDAAFGLGFVHAEDRLFQMELQRRYAEGRLAEIFGPDAVPVDKEMRVFGLARAAEAAIPFLSPEVNRALEAYAAGVNAFLASRRGALPPEFLLLRFRPEPWTEAASLLWGKLMALRLDGNYRGELLRAWLARSIPAADLAFLYPEYPKDAPTTLAAMLPIYRRLGLGRLYDTLPSAVGPHYASNNWVVDGRHSTSGKPVLANDPHLAFGAPGVWYLARVKTPGRTIAGATAAGVPLVIIGHNDRIAWGFTTTTADVEDLFVEKVDPADPGRYLTPQGSAPFATRREKILVRGAAPVEFTVRSTRHGPVLSDVLPPGSAGPGYVLALSATFAIPEDKSAEALWKVDRAADWPSFRAAWQDFVGPPQNSSMPMPTAPLALSRRGSCRSAKRARGGCRRQGGPANTIGRGLFRSTNCRTPQTLPQAVLSAPTTRSCPTAIPISSAATGTCRTAPSASAPCSTRPRRRASRRAPRSRLTHFR